MVGTAILLLFLVVATVTDIRSHKVFNWTTYPGILLAFICSSLATWMGVDSVHGTPAQQETWGLVPLPDCLAGFLACGLAMLICYVFFPGGVGGGDLKLLAMVGAYLGLYAGLEAMLWTFVLGGCQALIVLIWRIGIVASFRQAMAFCWYVLRTGGHASSAGGEPESPPANMFLSPSALIAVIVVQFRVAEWLRF